MSKKPKKKSGAGSTIALLAILLVGLSLLLYPTISDYWNSFTQSRAVANYAKQLENLAPEELDQIWTQAQEYNRDLTRGAYGPATPDSMKERYYQQLVVGDSGIIGVVDIPAIGVTMPIYHGTSEEVLQVAIGHLDWTSLPIGGEGTHCVVSGHRGLPSAKLFTHLDQLREGDIFMIQVLDQVLTYEVDQILIVEPHETEPLFIVEGKDYCTLVTCTPYGINSHRLLVRGSRIENLEEAKTVRLAADAMQVDPMIVAPLVAIPILLVLLIKLLVPKKKKHDKKEDGEDLDEIL